MLPEYRLAPEHPHPAALEDAREVMKALFGEADPRSVVLSGDSAGGGRALGLLHALREDAIELPAGCIALSPRLDLAPDAGGAARPAWLGCALRPPPHPRATSPAAVGLGVAWRGGRRSGGATASRRRRAGGDPGVDPRPGEAHGQRARRGAHPPRRIYTVVEHLVLALAQADDRERGGVLVRRRHERDREREVVPGQDEGQDRDREDARNGHREDDPAQRLQAGGAAEHPALLN